MKIGTKANIRYKGGPGSGHFGHSGRPGEVGGSTSGKLYDDIVDELRNISTEIAYILDENENIVSRQIGDVGSVDLTMADISGTKFDIIHNHPDQSGISIGDLRYMGHNEKINSMIIVTNNDVQKISIKDRKNLWRELSEVENYIAQIMADGTIAGTININNKNAKKIEFTAIAIQQLVDKGIIEIEYGYYVGKGGPGSGHFGHEGRPGEVGGSSSDSSIDIDISAPSQKEFENWARHIELAYDEDYIIKLANNIYKIRLEGWFDDCMESRDMGKSCESNIKDNYVTIMESESGWNADIHGYMNPYLDTEYGVTYIGELLQGEDFQVEKGGPGSGHFGHEGRPGLVGGSSSDTTYNIKPYTALESKGERHIDFYETGNDRDKISAEVAKKLLEYNIKEMMYGYVNDPKIGDDAKAAIAEWEHYENYETDVSGDMYNLVASARVIIKHDIISKLSEDSGESYETVNEVIKQWALSSNDHDKRSLQIQEAVSEEFGVKLSDWQKEKLDFIDNRSAERILIINDTAKELFNDAKENKKLYAKSKEKWGDKTDEKIHELYRSAMMYNEKNLFGFRFSDEESDISKIRKVLRSMYKRTQAHLKNVGYNSGDSVRLYRGIMFGNPSDVPKELVHIFKGNSLESWSVSKEVASWFGYTLVAANVPIESIISTSITGFGCFNEGEVVTFGSVDNSTAYVLSTAP